MFTRRERLILACWLLSWLIIPVAAQVRAGLFSTLVTTDTTANSLLVGGAVGGSTGTGGIKAGPITSTTNANATHLVTISNPNAGTAAIANLTLAGSAGAGNLYQFGGGYTTSGRFVQDSLLLESGGAGGLGLSSVNAAGGIKEYTGATPTLRWGINPAGDRTFGASSHIADSNGTPVIGSGWGGGTPSVSGTDYAFVVTFGTAPGTIAAGTITFGHTFSSGPTCVSGGTTGTPTSFSITTSTTVATFVAVGPASAGGTVSVLCRGV